MEKISRQGLPVFLTPLLWFSKNTDHVAYTHSQIFLSLFCFLFIHFIYTLLTLYFYVALSRRVVAIVTRRLSTCN